MIRNQHAATNGGQHNRDGQRTMKGLELPGLTFFGLLALMIVTLTPGMAAMGEAPTAPVQPTPTITSANAETGSAVR